ncbi:hypothetical protein D9M71_705190 [compost metagenome]
MPISPPKITALRGLFKPIIGATNGVITITRIALINPAAIDSAMTSELAPMAAPVTGPTM